MSPVSERREFRVLRVLRVKLEALVDRVVQEMA
jgi:hypothetical protein